jgi:hypothetical protein
MKMAKKTMVSHDDTGILDTPLTLTKFPDEFANRKEDLEMTMRELAVWIENQVAEKKVNLPWIKMATFGTKRNKRKSGKGRCLRWNENVLTVTGLEADYDAGTMTPEAARDALEEAGVAGLVYTTPSHLKPGKGCRWRVLAPFSRPLPPDKRADLIAKLNGILGGALDGTSFTLSQSYYAGNEKGGCAVETFLVNGQPIDTLEGLQPVYKHGGTKKRKQVASAAREGLSLQHIREAMATISNDPKVNSDAADYSWWIKIGMALFHETDGSEAGREVWHTFSEGHPDYHSGVTNSKWDTFGGGGDNPVTFAFIRREGAKRGWIDVSGFDTEIDADEQEETDELVGVSTSEIERSGQNRTYELDDDGVIRAFTDKYKNELRFDHTASRWFRFDGQHWQREETHLAKHYARDISTTLAAGNPRAKALKRVSNWEAIERGARTACEFACIAKIWDSDAFLLGTPGGTVDLKTGKLRKARPSDYISKITASAPVPLHSLNPARDCPHWLTFLQEALDRDADAIRFLQQWGGYNLTGVTREHALVFVYGPGGSGKSTAINTIADVIGDYSINVSTSTLTAAKHDAHSEELARLDGPRLAWASETEKGRAWAENRVKSLTGPVLWSEREIRSLPIKAYDDSRSLRISALARKRRRYCCIDCRIVGTELNRATKPLTLGGGMLIITKS